MDAADHTGEQWCALRLQDADCVVVDLLFVVLDGSGPPFSHAVMDRQQVALGVGQPQLHRVVIPLDSRCGLKAAVQHLVCPALTDALLPDVEPRTVNVDSLALIETSESRVVGFILCFCSGSRQSHERAAKLDVLIAGDVAAGCGG